MSSTIRRIRLARKACNIFLYVVSLLIISFCWPQYMVHMFLLMWLKSLLKLLKCTSYEANGRRCDRKYRFLFQAVRVKWVVCVFKIAECTLYMELKIEEIMESSPEIEERGYYLYCNEDTQPCFVVGIWERILCCFLQNYTIYVILDHFCIIR